MCPCCLMSKGCLKHCACACVGVGVINAQQAGGETDGEVWLWMWGLLLLQSDKMVTQLNKPFMRPFLCLIL